jgi:DEAD/DEAH box helicase domain-containing protein
MQAIQWYKQGKLMDVAEYCCYDVKLTRMVHEYGASRRQLFYKDRLGKTVPVPVDWRI